MARISRRALGKNEKILPGVRPNAGIEACYRKRLHLLVEAMAKSVEYWLKATYRANEPAVAAMLAQDKSPANELRDAMRELSRRWLDKFDEAAPELARWFSISAGKRSDAALRSILKKGGLTVKFKMTATARDIIDAKIAENVSLIRSIPREYLTQVEGAVMRSVTRGRDLETVAKQIERQFGVTKKRAAFIARDQNNKATSAIQEARRAELGIQEAIWLHSSGGKTPRPKHVAASGTRYQVGKGLKIGDKGQWVLPGEEPNCRCVSRAVIPGFS